MFEKRRIVKTQKLRDERNSYVCVHCTRISLISNLFRSFTLQLLSSLKTASQAKTGIFYAFNKIATKLVRFRVKTTIFQIF